MAAICSCSEDLDAIDVGQFFNIKPIFRRSFWTRAGGWRTDLHSTDSNDGGSYGIRFDLGSKWSHQSKHQDPYGVTLALATVNGDMDHWRRHFHGSWTSRGLLKPVGAVARHARETGGPSLRKEPTSRSGRSRRYGHPCHKTYPCRRDSNTQERAKLGWPTCVCPLAY